MDRDYMTNEVYGKKITHKIKNKVELFRKIKCTFNIL